MHHHKKLQRRVIIGAVIIAVLMALVAVPLAVNDQMRYDLAMQTNSIPGGNADQIADADDDALLIVLPLDNPGSGVTPWLYQAQFIAWSGQDGHDLENLETGERVTLPLDSIEFTSASGDGSLVLMRGIHANSGEPAAMVIGTATMQLEELPDADSVPDAPGDWEISIWEKVEGICNRPSPERQFVACFSRADLASYFAGDWQLDLQIWGDYEATMPLFRGMGFLPMVGFAQGGTVVYWQNERGIWQMDVPEDALDAAPPANPVAMPAGTPMN